MTIREKQTEVDNWLKQHKNPYWSAHEMLARLTEEMGELARQINHQYGPKKRKNTETEKKIEEELGDILFSLICMANSEGINLDEAFEKSMNKCYGRDNNRFEKL